MKTSAVAVGKRRSLLPAPKSAGHGPSQPASRTGEFPASKSKGIATGSSISLPGLKVITSTLVDDSVDEITGNVTGGKLADSSVRQSAAETHDGTESKQTRLQKQSNLQQSAVVARKRPTSASSVSNRGTRELNQSFSLSRTSLDSGNSAKPAAAKGAVVNDQNAKAKVSRLFRGATSALSSHSATDSTKQEKIPRSAGTTARKLKVPTKYASVRAVIAGSGSAETVSACSQAETVASAEPVISASLVTEMLLPENVASDTGTTFEPPESSSSNSVEGEFAAPVEGEHDLSESLLGTVLAAGEPDVLSRVKSLDQTIDDQEHLRSSSGSLVILDDVDLLDTSLLSFDSCWAPSAAAAVNNDTDACCVENPPDDITLPAPELCSRQSYLTSEVDPSLGVTGSDASSMRPLSLMSNSSTDMGIVADCAVHVAESRSQHERPSSYLSTCSADTGTFSVYIRVTG